MCWGSDGTFGDKNSNSIVLRDKLTVSTDHRNK